MSAGLELRVADRAGSTIIEVSGDLDLMWAGLELTEALDASVRAHADVLMDLSGTDFMDSTGLGLLVRTQRRLAQLGRTMVLVRPSTAVERMLALTKADTIIPVASTWAEAEEIIARST